MSSQPTGPPLSYRPPPIDGRGGPRSPLQLRAVATGVAVDWAATFLASYAILFLALAVAGARYQTQAEIEAYLEQLSAAPDFVALTSVVGLLCTTLGGLAAVAVARSGALRHALAVGGCSLALSLALDAIGKGGTSGWYPIWFRVLGYALVIPAGLLGGLLAERMGLAAPS